MNQRSRDRIPEIQPRLVNRLRPDPDELHHEAARRHSIHRETGYCPACGTLAELQGESDEEFNEQTRRRPPAFGIGAAARKSLCTLCMLAQNPKRLLYYAAQGWLWFLVGDSATLKSQAEINRRLWQLAAHAHRRVREVNRLAMLREVARGEFCGGPMQLPHEVFSPEDRAHVDGFFRDRLGPLADEFDTETRHALLYAAWGVPVLLLTAPSQGLAHWRSRERFVLTPEGLEGVRDLCYQQPNVSAS